MNNSINFSPENYIKALNELKAVGLKAQSEGIEIVRIAESGLSNTFAVVTIIDLSKKLEQSNPNCSAVIEGICGSGQQIVDQIRDSVSECEKGAVFYSDAMVAASAAVSSSNVAVYHYADQIAQVSGQSFSELAAMFEDGALKKVYTDDQIDELLSRYDPELVVRRKGAWQAYYSASLDSLAQASHTMRDILAKIVAKDASNELLYECPWFQKLIASKLREKPTMRDRVRFLLHGTNEEFGSDATLEVVEKEVSAFVEDDGALKKTAHGSTSLTRDAVKLSMDRIEGLLFLVLQKRFHS